MSLDFDNLYFAQGSSVTAPNVNGNLYLVNGEVKEWTGTSNKVYSPIYSRETNSQVQIGVTAVLSEKEATEALDAAVGAFNKGRGQWPSMVPKERIACLEKFLKGLKEIKNDIVNILQWEICKTKGDSEKEVDRTIAYIYDTINEYKKLENKQSALISEGGIVAQIKRSPLGVTLALGPFNYPFNETYTTLIPAILLGNTVILKTSRTGCLCHIPTLKLFQECFPPGVVNIIHGTGRVILPLLMKSGKVDILAFIGTSKAASELQKAHPYPHRLRAVLGLDAKNPAIILPDANLDVAVSECVLGSLSFNGQRCTAIKVIFVHKSIADPFLERFAKAVDGLKMGLPWDQGVAITPLPEPQKPAYLQEVLKDAISKGAKIINTGRGGKVDRTFVAPTVIYPVTREMRVYHEEQFGPLVPVVPYENIEDVYEFLVESEYGQQAAVFSENGASLPGLIDVLVHQVSRININAQCQRGPDSFPFTGRKNSASGTLSVFDALRAMSIRTVVATKQTENNIQVIQDIICSRKSAFVRQDFLA